MRAALFDMDRTLVRTDTATLYMRWQRREGRAGLRDVARVGWWMLKYTFGVIDAQRIARTVVGEYAGKSEHVVITDCERWYAEDVRRHVCDLGRVAVERHREAGDLVAIVTGATPYAARPLARDLGIEHVLCTELEVEEGRFTGRVHEPLCYAEGKIERAERLAAEHGFDLADASFYSDSVTDLPLLERVREPVCVNPDPRLKRVAQRRGWRVEQW